MYKCCFSVNLLRENSAVIGMFEFSEILNFPSGVLVDGGKVRAGEYYKGLCMLLWIF